MINSNVVEEGNTKSANKVLHQQKKLSFRIVHKTYDRRHIYYEMNVDVFSMHHI